MPLTSTIASGTSRKPFRSRPSGKCSFASVGQPRLGEDVGQPLALGLGLADDEHLLPVAGGVQLVAHLGDVAAETLDRFDLQLAGRFQRRSTMLAAVTEGKLIDLASALR